MSPRSKHLLWAAPLALALASHRSKAWRKKLIARKDANRWIAQTAKGPVEYGTLGYGDPVLVLHGTPGGYDQGLGMAGLWDRKGLRFLAVSRPGYLGTPLSTGRTPEEQADAYAAFLDAMDIPKLPVIGASGGGPSAIHFAARHPGRITRLVLLQAVSAPMDIPKRNPMRSALESDMLAWMGVRLCGLWQKLSRNPIILGNPGAVVAGMESVLPQDLLREGIDNDVAQMNALAPLPLSEIAAPTLLVHGRMDDLVPYAFSKHAAKSIPGARLYTLQNGDHFTTPLDPLAVEAIGAFLDPVIRPTHAGVAR